MSTKKILILGGSGGLSGELASRALQNGCEVWTLTRGNRPLHAGIHSLIADRNDAPAFKAAVLSAATRWDCVYDCICMNELNAQQDLEIISKVTSQLIVVSTDSVYDPHHKKILQNEEGVFIEESGDPSVCSYGGNKRKMEKVFLESSNISLNYTLLRPGHIYGKGFKLGCFPEESRRDDLADRIRSGQPLYLVGMGTYLIHPIYVGDLAQVMLECMGNPLTYNRVFCIGGPEIIENRRYYEILGEILKVTPEIHEVPLEGYLDSHPEYSGHLCHRAYDLSAIAATGINLPSTKLSEGLPKLPKC